MVISDKLGEGSASTGGEDFARLYDEWGPSIYRRCLKMLRDDDEARDATQDVFLKLMKYFHKYPDRYEDRGKILNLMFRIATNHCLNILRRRKKGRRLFVPFDPQVMGKDVRTPEGKAIQREAIVKALMRLSRKNRELVYYRFWDELTLEEIGAVMGLSRKTVARRLEKALEKMREFIEEWKGGP